MKNLQKKMFRYKYVAIFIQNFVTTISSFNRPLDKINKVAKTFTRRCLGANFLLVDTIPNFANNFPNCFSILIF